MKKDITCIIVEDEFLAGKLLESYIDKTEGLSLINIFENPVVVPDFLENNEVDLVLLDIQMPQMRGTKLASKIKNDVHIVFTTAYSEYAVESYEYEAIDYLVKPIRYERFVEAVKKVQKKIHVIENKEEPEITVKSGYDVIKIKLRDIFFIEGMKEYVAFHTAEKRILSYLSLKSLINTLPDTEFIRIHRSFIVNKSHITSLHQNKLIVRGKELPVSRSYYKAVKSELSGNL